jgi:hypothetical protein
MRFEFRSSHSLVPTIAVNDDAIEFDGDLCIGGLFAVGIVARRREV